MLKFYSLITTLYGLLKQLTHTPARLSNINIWFYLNTHIFLFKLTNYLSFYMYICDTLQLKQIRVYNKTFNLLSIVLLSIKILLITSILLWF